MEPSVRKAAFPFDEDDADITLWTSDNVEFRVHCQWVILSLASSVFKDMFSMPQPSTGENEPITVSEDDETLDIFLRICYPTISTKPSLLGQVRKVLAAATKYDAPLVLDHMRETLMAPEFLDSQPFVVFTIACFFHLEEVAQAAAEIIVTISNPATSVFSTTFDYPKLDDVSAGVYYRLLQIYKTRTTIMEPPAKRREKKKGNATTLEPKFTVDFRGIAPVCCPSVPWQSLPPTKSQLESVSHPFSDTTGDLILRTSNGSDFCAYLNILALASPTFLCAVIATEIEDRPDRVPIYQVQESAVVLDMLLRMCYPVPHPQPSDPDTFLVVLYAAHKHEMSKAKQILWGGWLPFAESSPMRFYFAAVKVGWKEEAKGCADRLASLSIHNIQTIYVPEMESIGSAPYRNLLVYLSSGRASRKELEWVKCACGMSGTVPLCIGKIRR